ncbi:hypothetical protein PAXRUDRAFT_672068 [Paxillus rubicundulus Ve08.2h10]|uniref:Uncharacterized protein n=1 Tax=Paxillus rubicundulus Ve08.2h10 TaxID=930991 RepID=A0A0D0DWR7_9AGAM|nr:hypothetical protein PAXRUDRAFT_672068 [Paxillus rubicundulus Ve08.2h10]
MESLSIPTHLIPASRWRSGDPLDESFRRLETAHPTVLLPVPAHTVHSPNLRRAGAGNRTDSPRASSSHADYGLRASVREGHVVARTPSITTWHRHFPVESVSLRATQYQCTAFQLPMSPNTNDIA